MVSATIDAALEVRSRDEAIPTARIIVIKGESLPLESMNLPSKDRMPDPPIDKEKKRRKEKVAIVKKACKVCLDEPGRGSSEDQGVDPFGNVDIIWDLTDSDLFMTVGPPHACPPQEGKLPRGGVAEVAQVVEEFKTSPKMDLNITFSQETFIKGFELYEGKVVRRFPELDLSFLKEEEAND
ncbi:hypothetical protein COCNU_scaffold000363G000020 [Cocos nucifera]|nr:hypothetical protein [Cocos nucifera]